MKIAMVAPIEESVPPKTYGGTELVAYFIIKELIEMGHEVTLLGSGDSKTPAKLVPLIEQSLRARPEGVSQPMRDVFKYLGAARAVDHIRGGGFDIVHNHLSWRLIVFSDLLEAPMASTLHGPLDIGYQREVFKLYPQANYVSISLNQRKAMPNLNFVANVYNGIEVDKFEFYPDGKDYFAFLGRMSPEKGPVEAIQIAKAAGVKLVMAAKIDNVDQEYFDDKVKPLIDGDQIKFIGEVNFEQKNELLGNSLGLLSPIQWEEPFGLVFVEAMACGAPVITMRRGSTSELIVDGQTGFICDSVDEATDKIKQVDKLSRQACRDHVAQNFTTKVMAQHYLKAYESVLASK